MYFVYDLACYLCSFQLWGQTCTVLGMGGTCLVSVFSRISQTRRRGPALFLEQLIIYLICTCCEHFRPSSTKVRPPGHVSSTYFRKSSVIAVVVTPTDRSLWSFQQFFKRNSMFTNVTPWNMVIGDLRSAQFCDLNFKSIGNIKCAFFEHVKVNAS